MKTWKPLETILFLSTVLWHLPAFLLAFPTIHVKTVSCENSFSYYCYGVTDIIYWEETHLWKHWDLGEIGWGSWDTNWIRSNYKMEDLRVFWIVAQQNEGSSAVRVGFWLWEGWVAVAPRSPSPRSLPLTLSACLSALSFWWKHHILANNSSYKGPCTAFGASSLTSFLS